MDEPNADDAFASEHIRRALRALDMDIPWVNDGAPAPQVAPSSRYDLVAEDERLNDMLRECLLETNRAVPLHGDSPADSVPGGFSGLAPLGQSASDSPAGDSMTANSNSV